MTDYGDTYDMPSTQTVYVRQVDPFIPFNISQLQQNYFNVDRRNYDQANLALTYFDLPAQDSIKQVIGPYTNIKITITVTYMVFPPDPQSAQAPDSYTNTQVLDNVPLYIPFKANSADVALALKTTLLKAAMNNIHTADGSINTTIDPIIVLGGWLKDVYYDNQTGKISLLLGLPDTADLSSPPATPSYVLQKLILQFENAQQYIGPYGLQNIDIQHKQLVAALLGADFNSVTGNWSAVLEDQGNRDSSIITTNVGETRPIISILSPLTGFNSSQPHSDMLQLYYDMVQGYNGVVYKFPNVSRLCIDPYAYLRGGPEANIWRPDGTKIQATAVIPRNRLDTQFTDVSHATLHQPKIRSSLNAIRNMNLMLTDSEGRALLLDDEFVFLFEVSFDLRQYSQQ